MQQGQDEARGAQEQGSSAGVVASLRGAAAAPGAATQAAHAAQANETDFGTPAASAVPQVIAVCHLI